MVLLYTGWCQILVSLRDVSEETLEVFDISNSKTNLEFCSNSYLNIKRIYNSCTNSINDKFDTRTFQTRTCQLPSSENSKVAQFDRQNSVCVTWNDQNATRFLHSKKSQLVVSWSSLYITHWWYSVRTSAGVTCVTYRAGLAKVHKMLLVCDSHDKHVPDLPTKGWIAHPSTNNARDGAQH